MKNKTTYDTIVQQFEDTKRYRNGKLHCEDGPAVERADGSKQWYRHGLVHREDGPALELKDGTKAWFRDGQLHREDGPAIVWSNGEKRWWRDGIQIIDPDEISKLMPQLTPSDMRTTEPVRIKPLTIKAPLR
jgi:hypothetical protein